MVLFALFLFNFMNWHFVLSLIIIYFNEIPKNSLVITKRDLVFNRKLLRVTKRGPMFSMKIEIPRDLQFS